MLRVLRRRLNQSTQSRRQALRTSIFGIDDRRRWCIDTGASWPDTGATSASTLPNRASAMRCVLDQLGAAARTHPGGVAAELYDGWRGISAALSEGERVARETWRRVRYVIDEARAWSDATGGTIAEYLAWVDRRIDDIDRVELSTDEGEDSVRIMTVHAAKGLEFPITVVAGLGGADAPDAQTGLRWHGDTPLVRLGKMTSSALGDVSTYEKLAGRAEEARLLYVAFTRAKDHLVVSMHHKTGNCAAGRLLNAVTSPAAVPLATLLEPHVPTAHPPDHRRPSIPGDAELPEPDELDRTVGQVRRMWTPSGLAKALGDASGPTSDVTLVQGSLFAVEADVDDADLDLDDAVVVPGERFGAAVGRHQPDSDDHEASDPGNRKEPGPNDRPSRRGGRFGTAKGSAVHAVMQQVLLDEPLRGLSTLIDVASEAEGVLDRKHDIELMVHSLLKGDLFLRMQASANCRREMYVGAQFGEVTIWGYVDAVACQSGWLADPRRLQDRHSDHVARRAGIALSTADVGIRRRIATGNGVAGHRSLAGRGPTGRIRGNRDLGGCGAGRRLARVAACAGHNSDVAPADVVRQRDQLRSAVVGDRSAFDRRHALGRSALGDLCTRPAKRTRVDQDLLHGHDVVVAEAWRADLIEHGALRREAAATARASNGVSGVCPRRSPPTGLPVTVSSSPNASMRSSRSWNASPSGNP